MNGLRVLCPCKSEKMYQECCQHYHEGFPPDNALVLMRSRYSAYALGLVDYIIKTTHSENPDFNPNKTAWRRHILQFSEETRFEGLKIVGFLEQGEEAFVTFTAYLIAGGKDHTFTEKSRFVKEGEWWLYHSGEFL